MESSGNITCPNCEHTFHVEDVITKQLENKFKHQILQEKSRLEVKYNSQLESLNKERQEFESKKEQENEIFKKRMREEKNKLHAHLKSELKEQFAHTLKLQAKELDELTKQLQGMQTKDIELQQLKRKMELQRKEIEFEYEKKLLQNQRQLEEQLSTRIREELELKLKEKDKQLDDQRKMIQEMQRKAEQGSVQLQGEVQELTIEDWLHKHFPTDDIVEIKKGARGADCIQQVHTRKKRNCGTIYYESKRTKAFQSAWISKFKQDMIQQNADIGVIITQTMPAEMSRMGQKSGIWICTLEEFKSLCFILRQMLIKVSEVTDEQRNKGDKMNLLYSYLTSNEFKLKIESIVEGFSQMQTDLQKEKNAMNRIWSQREKQIQKVLINTTEMYGDIKGIAGAAIPNVRQLELPIEHNEVFDLKDETVEDNNL